MIALLLEAMSIFYLCSKDSFRLILMSYATMASIAAFDDLYSSSIGEHPLHNIVGKKIPTIYRRSLRFQGEKVQEALDIQMNAMGANYGGILNESKDIRNKAGVGAALTTMADGHGGGDAGGGDAGGGDGGFEGGLGLELSTS